MASVACGCAMSGLPTQIHPVIRSSLIGINLLWVAAILLFRATAPSAEVPAHAHSCYACRLSEVLLRRARLRFQIPRRQGPLPLLPLWGSLGHLSTPNRHREAGRRGDLSGFSARGQLADRRIHGRRPPPRIVDEGLFAPRACALAHPGPAGARPPPVVSASAESRWPDGWTAKHSTIRASRLASAARCVSQPD